MTRKEGEQHSSKQEKIWILEMERQLRQIYHMGRIFYEMNRNEEGRYNHETGRILFDTILQSEGRPTALTSLVDPKRDETKQEAWNNRTTEIINLTEIWLCILDDGAVEIQYEHTRYDQGYLTPSVDLDDVPKAISTMTCRMRKEKKESEKDPIGSYADIVSHSSKTVLRRSQEVFIIRPNGAGSTVEKSGWVQEYDYGGNTTKDEVTQLSTFSAGNNEVSGYIMTLRLNMLSKLRYLLNKAGESEDPDYYTALFTPVIKRNILQMALSEIRIAAENGEVRDEKEEVSFQGGSQYIGGFIWPTADYSYTRITNNSSGEIDIERTNVGHNLIEGYMFSDIKIPVPTPTSAGFGAMMQINSISNEVVREWENARKKTIGKDAYRSEIKAEIEQLKLGLINNEGSVYGQIRILTIDPTTGAYTYQFAQRIPEGDLHNHTGETQLEVHQENPQDPSCDELDTLLTLII